MIHVLYDHGDERPATDLTPAQVRAARLDAAGLLWIDLEAPSEDELSAILKQALDIHVPVGQLLAERCGSVAPMVFDSCALVPLQSSDVRPPTAELTPIPERSTLGLLIGGNYVITLHAEPWPFVTHLREALANGTGPMPKGRDGLVAEIMALLIRHERQRLETASAALARLHQRRGVAPDGEFVGRLVAVRNQLAALQADLEQQIHVARWLADEGASPITASGRVYFSLVSQALGSQRERAACLLRAAGHLADGQRTLLHGQMVRWIRALTMLWLMAMLGAVTLAASALVIWWLGAR